MKEEITLGKENAGFWVYLQDGKYLNPGKKKMNGQHNYYKTRRQAIGEIKQLYRINFKHINRYGREIFTAKLIKC